MGICHHFSQYLTYGDCSSLLPIFGNANYLEVIPSTSEFDLHLLAKLLDCVPNLQTLVFTEVVLYAPTFICLI
uniref:Uncharacterized protein n=1 Tax=Nelumbo nucifera TaxID=4432 RepID=A0A822Z5J3_NELNU|nr:TPA_asm: hypothetical protein HUJ06_013037 [Nelumbo nucifera]